LQKHHVAFGDELMDRLKNLVEIQKQDDNIYALHLMPLNTEWGHGRDNNFVTYEGNRLNILVLGFVEGSNLYDSQNHDLLSNYYIRVSPIIAGVIAFSRKLLYRLTGTPGLFKPPSPSQATMDDMYITFSTPLTAFSFSGKANSDNLERTAPPFTRLFDATRSFEPGVIGTQLATSALKKHDLVAIEGHIHRNEDMKKKGKMTANYTISAIHILAYAEPRRKPVI